MPQNDLRDPAEVAQDPRYVRIAREAGFTQWEIDHCPVDLIAGTTAYQLTQLGVAVDDLKEAVKEVVGRAATWVLERLGYGQ